VENDPVNWNDPLGLSGIARLTPGTGGLVAPAAPPGVNVEENLIEAGSNGISFWINHVKKGGKWDYKQLGFEKYENFGNYNYGFTGKQFWPEGLLLRAAGFVQEESDPAWGHWWGGPPYGDDPKDQLYIQLGIIDYERRKNCPEGDKEED